MKPDEPKKLDGLVADVKSLMASPRELDFRGILNPHTINGGNKLIAGLPPEYADRRPLKFNGKYLWHPEGNDGTVPDNDQTGEPERYAVGYYRDHLPPAVFAELRGYVPSSNPAAHKLVKTYYTEEAAQLALREAVGAAGKK